MNEYRGSDGDMIADATRRDIVRRTLHVRHGPGAPRRLLKFVAVEPNRPFEVRDGFADADGNPDPALPAVQVVYTFEEADGGSRVVTASTFTSLEALEQLLGTGMEEGTRSAMRQMDDVVADLSPFAAGRPADAQLIAETQARISRVIRGSVQQVWDAHHEPEIVRRWMLGSDGWTMPVCEVGTAVGQTHRSEWQQVDGEGRFGFTGEVLEFEPPYREVTTERMVGTDGPSTVNEVTLTPVEGGTLLTLIVTYPDAETRETVLATGMTDGMEASYARLESEVLDRQGPCPE